MDRTVNYIANMWINGSYHIIGDVETMEVPNIEFDELFCKGADAYNELETQLEQAGIDSKCFDECCKAIQNDTIFIGFNLGYWYGKDRDKYNKLVETLSTFMKDKGAGSDG